jgi:8-oxo-dGTP diphosphatase
MSTSTAATAADSPLPDPASQAGEGSARREPGAGAGCTILLVAAVALIDVDGRVLLAQRPAGKHLAGLWEFPGGKIHLGETPETALIRELSEELGIDVAASCLAPFTFASHPYPEFHLLMPLYVCRRWDGIAIAQEGQRLAWVRPNRLKEYPMPPADLPLISHLTSLL